MYKRYQEKEEGSLRKTKKEFYFLSFPCSSVGKHLSPRLPTVKEQTYVSSDIAAISQVCFGGDVAQLVERRTGTPPTQVRFPGAARDFSPRLNI